MCVRQSAHDFPYPCSSFFFTMRAYVLMQIFDTTDLEDPFTRFYQSFFVNTKNIINDNFANYALLFVADFKNWEIFFLLRNFCINVSSCIRIHTNICNKFSTSSFSSFIIQYSFMTLYKWRIETIAIKNDESWENIFAAHQMHSLCIHCSLCRFKLTVNLTKAY